LILKGTSSWFDRKIETNVFGMDAHQLSYFSEVSYLKKWNKNDLVVGINFTGEIFIKNFLTVHRSMIILKTRSVYLPR
jgi:hypothetical protein